jgi:hypothetical protein
MADNAKCISSVAAMYKECTHSKSVYCPLTAIRFFLNDEKKEPNHTHTRDSFMLHSHDVCELDILLTHSHEDAEIYPQLFPHF